MTKLPQSHRYKSILPNIKNSHLIVTMRLRTMNVDNHSIYLPLCLSLYASLC